MIAPFGRYVRYLGYVLRHKWYVFRASRDLGIPWRGLVHDLSKFRPSELLPYARYFYEPDGSPRTRRDKTGYYKAAETGDHAFDIAWMHHQHRNPHHWQYWVLPLDDGGVRALRMPEEYVLEMVADWRGASLAQGYGSDVVPWYLEHMHLMTLHPETRWDVEDLIGVPHSAVGPDGTLDPAVHGVPEEEAEPDRAPLSDEERVEAVADVLHEIWMRWAREIAHTEGLSQCRLVRWLYLMVPYHHLPEDQRETDRRLARQVLHALEK